MRCLQELNRFNSFPILLQAIVMQSMKDRMRIHLRLNLLMNKIKITQGWLRKALARHQGLDDFKTCRDNIAKRWQSKVLTCLRLYYRVETDTVDQQWRRRQI